MTNLVDLCLKSPISRTLRGKAIVNIFISGSYFKRQDLSTKLTPQPISRQHKEVGLLSTGIVVGSKIIIAIM